MSDAAGLMSGRSAVVFGMDDIGRGIALRFLREGARVALIDPDARRAHSFAVPLGSWASPHDADGPISIRQAIDAAARALGGVHVLVNNLLPPPVIAPLESQHHTAYDHAFGTVIAAHSAMQSALPYMQSAGSGRIINVGHRYGANVNESIGAYNSAAWALVGLTRTASVDWGRYQIATNLLLPLADTAEMNSYRERKPALIDLLCSQLPLGRLGDPVDDVGGAAVFLAGDAANFINGEIVHADGGQHIAGPVLNPGKFK